MPMPPEYRHASREFDSFVEELRERLGTDSRNVAYTTAQAVLVVFRRRLSVSEGLAFAQVLPAVLRAIFIDGWTVAATPVPFADREALTDEVLAFRHAHNFAPRSAISDVARVLREHTDQAAFARVLATLPPEARDYWAADSDPSQVSPTPRRGD